MNHTKIIISPAKTLDWESPFPSLETNLPTLIKETMQLVAGLKKLSPQQVKQLMNISDKLALLNHQRFQNWHYPYPSSARPAIFSFKGDVYEGIDINSFDISEIQRLEKHLFILSGLYGILKPLDLILPYRLEMGTKFKNSRGLDLYQFWGDRVAHVLQDSLLSTKHPLLINLASNEYYQVLKNHLSPEIRVIQPVFKDLVKGEYKVVSFWAKKARGLMVKFIIQEKIKKVEELKNFDSEGYAFNTKSSTESQWVFLRKP